MIVEGTLVEGSQLHVVHVLRTEYVLVHDAIESRTSVACGMKHTQGI